MRKPQDLTGKQFGRWTVIRAVWPDGVHVKWESRCECGTIRNVMRHSLIKGLSRSCGCLNREEIRAAATTHGLSGHPLFSMWRTMLNRCRNPNSKSWKNYGARGIKVCERWHDFGLFFEDMEPSWRAGLTIEREDNDGDYEPSNCRWIPKGEQSRNRRYCIYIDTPKGRMTVSEAATAYGLKFATLRARLERGWPPEELFRPAGPKGTNGTDRANWGKLR